MAGLLPNCNGRRRETGVGKVANGNAEVSRKSCILPEKRRAARWTEMEDHGVAAVGYPLPLCGFARDRDLVIAVAHLVADHGARSSLACQAMAHGVARRFAFDREVKLSAAASGMACHCSASIIERKSLRIRVGAPESRLTSTL
jgi:hypothetical protein